MTSHQARAKLLKTLNLPKTLIEHIVAGSVSSQERNYILGSVKSYMYNGQDIPIDVAKGTKSRTHFVFGTNVLKILNAANTFQKEIMERFPDDLACTTLVDRRIRAIVDRLAVLPNQGLNEVDEYALVRSEYDELVKLASFLVQHDLRPLGDYEATSTLLGW